MSHVPPISVSLSLSCPSPPPQALTRAYCVLQSLLTSSKESSSPRLTGRSTSSCSASSKWLSSSTAIVFSCPRCCLSVLATPSTPSAASSPDPQFDRFSTNTQTSRSCFHRQSLGQCPALGVLPATPSATPRSPALPPRSLNSTWLRTSQRSCSGPG